MGRRPRRQVHGQNWRDPVHYHVVLNTGEVTYDEAVAVILGLAGRRSGAPGLSIGGAAGSG